MISSLSPSTTTEASSALSIAAAAAPVGAAASGFWMVLGAAVCIGCTGNNVVRRQVQVLRWVSAQRFVS